MALDPIFSSLIMRGTFYTGFEETISSDEEDSNSTTPASDEVASSYFDELAYERARTGTEPFSAFSKKRSFSEISDEVAEISRKKIKIETLLSDSPSDIYKGVILLKKEMLDQLSSEESKSFQSILELEKFEKLFRTDHYKNGDDYYYTSQTGTLPNYPQELLADNIFILTGKLEEHPIPADASESLRENLYAAQETIKYVHNWIPFSNYYLQRSQLFNQEKYDPACIRKITEVLQKSFQELNTKAPYTCPLNLIVKESLKHKVGNGAYLALCGYYCLKKMGVDADLVSIEPGDYGFLLLGRNKAIPLSDYKNWGEGAVVCDTLTGAFYPASELSKHLMDGCNIMIHKEIQFTLVKQFNPSTQTLFHVPDPKET